ncbi:hypothetical protein GA0061094_1365 [[Bacillus] enclensis]|uniref:Uncharacterized protein n=1 Tax=[Bacillus] enclensis TaxID=1402860 RepID=A0A1C4A9Z3_9BACI|nr:hypothetical protein GA0061094_1365 [[Bacillus] enclensis]
MIRVQDETPAGEVANVRRVQLRRLAPRGHKLNGPRRQKTPSRPIHLMLVGAERAAYAFLFVQLQGLEAYVISQLVQEGKERLRGRFALCQLPLGKALPFFYPEAHQPPAESEVLHGNQQRQYKNKISFKDFQQRKKE